MLSDHTLHVVCHEGSYTKPVFAGVLSLIFILYTHVHWMPFKVDRKSVIPHACNLKQHYINVLIKVSNRIVYW